MAVPFAVAISKVTPPVGAGALKVTVKVKGVMPLLPSLAVTLLMVRLGSGEQELVAVALLRGLGEPVAKFVLFASVSVQPFAARSTARVLLGAGASAPSKQFAVVP